MALPTNPPISLNQIKTEFGATGTRSLTEFYRGGSYVPNIPANSGVPTSGSISLLDFLGASNLVMPAWGPGLVRSNSTAPANAIARVMLFSSTGGTIPDWNGQIRGVTYTGESGYAQTGLNTAWLPAGMNSSEFRVRFVELSRDPNTVYPIGGDSLNTWHSLSSNRSVTLEAKDGGTGGINTWYNLLLRVDIALAGTTTPVYSNTVKLAVARTYTGNPPLPYPEP